MMLEQQMRLMPAHKNSGVDDSSATAALLGAKHPLVTLVQKCEVCSLHGGVVARFADPLGLDVPTCTLGRTLGPTGAGRTPGAVRG